MTNFVAKIVDFMQNLVTSEQIQAFSAALSAKQNIVIFTHLSPDGDAMGSSLGLMHYLHSLGKNATIIVPNKFPPFLAWMPGSDKVVIHEEEPERAKAVAEAADLAVFLDFNEPKRVGDAAELFSCCKGQKILVDHHLHPCLEMADLVISYPEAPAASYLVLELILSQTSSADSATSSTPSPMPEAVATCLYTGLMTDTGNFAFNSNNPNLYEMIATLLRAGINKDKIYDAVFNQYSVDRLRFTGYCIYHKMRIFPKYHTALIALTAEELRRFNFQSGDAEGIVNMPLQIGNVYYSCFMREDVDKVKMSFRSQGDRPVNVFAHECFNGGGHMNAAGGEFYGSVQDAVKVFENNYVTYFKKE